MTMQNKAGEGDTTTTICIKLDRDLANWLSRISKYLPYSVEDVIIGVLKFYMNTWLMIENAIRQEEAHQPPEEEPAGQGSVELIRQLLEATEPGTKGLGALQGILRYRKLVKSFTEWLTRQGIPANDVTEDVINTFIEEYSKVEKGEEVDPTAWRQVLRDVVELKKSGFDVDRLIAKYDVVAKYKSLVRSFVQWLHSKGKDPGTASSGDIKEFLSTIKHSYSEKTIASYYKVLRYYLDLYKAGMRA